ncbi:MAG: hypothetical protein WBS20_05795 [Lysobacterales bacterium]
MAKKTWIKRIVVAALIAELAYVIVFNLVLQLPLTRTLINQIRPDKFYITWESAWTPYPFRFYFRNASGNGQSRSQQWEFEAQAVAASIDALPLIYKRIWIDHVRLADASYFQRPRLKPDRDYTGLLPFYPPISGREITGADTTPKSPKKAWHVNIEDIRLDGQYRYWVHRLKGQAHGTLEADLDVVTRGGLFSITVPDINLELDRHFTGESQELFRHGVISGELAFAPFIPGENRGSKVLRYLLIDAGLNIDMNSLDFIEPLTRKYRDLQINGTGLVDGHLHMEEGRVLAGTDLSVDAENLNVNIFSHIISGNGAVRIKSGLQPENKLDLNVRFDDMVIEQLGGSKTLLTGQGLVLNGASDNELIRIQTDDADSRTGGFKNKLKQAELELKIPAAVVADMAVFNHYIPPGAPLSFTRGTAELEADISLRQEDADGFLRLKARGMEALIDEQSIRADFSADISVVDGSLGELLLDISGSELRLDNVMVIGEKEEFNQKNWSATLTLSQAQTILPNPFRLKAKASLHMTDSRPIVALLGNQKSRPRWIKRMLTIEDVTGNVELDFTNPRLVIPAAFMISDKIELGAKGIIDKDLRSGVIYARYKKLDIVVKIADGKRNIDLTRARRKYNAYLLPGEPE